MLAATELKARHGVNVVSKGVKAASQEVLLRKKGCGKARHYSMPSSKLQVAFQRISGSDKRMMLHCIITDKQADGLCV